MGHRIAMVVLDTCLILTSVVGFILLVIGYSIPDWLYVTRTLGNANESSIHMSIWYDTLCAVGYSNCRHSSSHDNLSSELVRLDNKDYKVFVDAISKLIEGKLEWATWQALSTLSLILALLGVVFAIVLVIYLRCNRHTYYRVFVVQGFLMMLASSTLMWIPVGMMAQVHYDLNNDLYKLSSVSGGAVTNSMVSIRSPSGLIVAGVGAFLVVIAGFLFLFYPCCIDTSESESSTESIRDGRSHSMNAEEVLSESNVASKNIWDILLLLITGLALLFLVLGYALPSWLYTTYIDSLSRTSTVHMSIWYNTLCPAFLPKCITTSHSGINDDLTNLNDAEYMVLVGTVITSTNGDLVWDAWQAMTTISVIMVFLGLILAFYFVWYMRSGRTKYITFFAVQGFCFMLVSAVLMWVPVGMAADVNRDLNNDLSYLNSKIKGGSTASSKHLTMNAPSALILAAIGAFFASVSAVVYLCYLFRPHGRTHRRSSQNSDHEEYSKSRLTGSSTIHGALIVFTMLGFILLAIGYAIPDWVYVTTTVNTNIDASFHMSIWYITLCSNTRNACKTSIHSGLSQELKVLNNTGYNQFVDMVLLKSDGNLAWTVWQSLTTISVCLVFLGLVFAISLVCCVKRKHYKYFKILAVQGFIFLFIANVLMWVTIGMVVDVNRTLDIAFMTLARSIPALAVEMNLEPPSGLILAAIGTFFSFIAAVIFLCYLCTCRKRRSTQRSKYYTYTKYPNATHNISYVEDPRYIYSRGAPPAYYDQRVIEYDDQPMVEYMRQSKRDYREYDASQKITAGPSRYYRYYEYPYHNYKY